METPVACTLTPAQYRIRTADLAALAQRALRSREQTQRGERLTFDAGDDVRRDLETAVAAEASCCSFLSMDLREDGDRLVLDISGPQDARPIIAELFA
jgi:hypothetical protein